MTSLSRSNGSSGAESEVSGVVSTYADWNEDIYFFDPSTGAAMDLTGLAFQFQFRTGPSDISAVVTLSTTSGTLSIQENSDSVDCILRIAAPRGTFAVYQGDMIADLIATDQANQVVHYAHGIITFTNNPVSI